MQETSHEQQDTAMQTTAILPAQSLSLVQIFLNAVIASILYQRGLLKRDSPVFADRYVADLLAESGPATYEDFLDVQTRAEDAKSQLFKILIKGHSKAADKIVTRLVRMSSLAQLRN